MTKLRIIFIALVSFLAGAVLMAGVGAAAQTSAQTKTPPTPDPCVDQPAAANATPATVPAGANRKEMTLITYTVAESGINNNLYFYGMLQNTTPLLRSGVEVVVTLTDDKGDVVGTSSTNIAEVGSSKPGELYPVFTLIDVTGPYAKVDVSVSSKPGDPPSYLKLYRSFEFSKITTGKSFGWTAKGSLKNTGKKEAQFVQVIGVAYDAKNNIMGITTAYTGMKLIAPGASSPFELQFANVKTKPARFDYFVSGREADQ
jgi:hypothetical protein